MRAIWSTALWGSTDGHREGVRRATISPSRSAVGCSTRTYKLRRRMGSPSLRSSFEVNTEYSERPLPLDHALVGLLRRWQQQTEFKAQSDWVWASPFQAGTLPYYSNWIQREYITKAGLRAGLGANVGWHKLRHTSRAWLDKAGAPLGVQKDLMRHANIGTTMNVYGGALPEEQRRANSAVVGMVIQ